VVVGVRVLRTFDFIIDLHTQLFHNHQNLVMFDGRNTRQTGNVAGIKAAAAGGDLLLQKGKKAQKNDKQRNQSVADLSSKLDQKKKLSYLAWCSPAAWALSEFGYVGAISEALVEFDDYHLQDLDPTCPHKF